MEVFEMRETISESQNTAELMHLKKRLQDDMQQLEEAFAASLEANNKIRGVNYAVRLKYYSKVGIIFSLLFLLFLFPFSKHFTSFVCRL